MVKLIDCALSRFLAHNKNKHTKLDRSLLRGLEVGPGLGMVKSSSLESLHNVMHHQIRRESASDLRSRETRNSFKRAVDRTYDDSAIQHRGVDARGMLPAASLFYTFSLSPLYIPHVIACFFPYQFHSL